VNQGARAARLQRRAAGAALVSLVLTGCGSTVQVSSTRAVSSGGQLTTDGMLAGAPQATATLNPGGTGGRLPQGPGGTSGAGATGSVLTRGAAPTARAGAAPGAASSRTPVKIGVITQQGLESAAKAFGLDGVTTGDTRKQVEAVVSWIKASGGLAGRPIQVFQYDADLAAGSGDAVMTQACTAFTQDVRVDYVVTVLAGLKVLAACLQKAGVGLLADNTNFADSTMSKHAPILANPSELGAGRMMDLLVDHLWSVGWLTASSTVGVIARDDSDGHEVVETSLAAALKRHGLTAKVTRFINDTQGDGGSSASANAVLGFRAAGVDRVFPAGYSPLYFMTAAESQGYRPAYAMVSAQAPGGLLESLAPANQLKNAAGIGWQPYLDIGKGTKPGPVSARETLCLQLMQKAVQAATSSLVKGFQVQVCDLLFYLKALTDLRPDLPKDLLTSARKALGARYVSPATYRVDVTHRTAGMAGYRPLTYKDDCQCFQYVGPLVKAS
jgi:hypothetical protein